MKKKTVVMAGTSGLIGTYLKEYLNQYELLEISRDDLNLTDKEFAKKYRGSIFLMDSYKGYGQGSSFPDKQQ